MQTPERIEAYKTMIRQLGALPPSIAMEALAALEESQQQNVTLKEELEDKINESNEFYKWWQEEVSHRNIYKHELVEAQQTIARQREALEYYAHVYVAHERLEEWDNGKRARAALEGEES